jgi:hypothetical protein
VWAMGAQAQAPAQAEPPPQGQSQGPSQNQAPAGGFSASVSPPRVEIAVTPGQTSRQIIDIQHAAQQSGRYRVYTSDWSLQPDGSVTFNDTLVMGSCRPWVAIERRDLNIQAQSRYRYRFEVAVPANASAGECRFAIMLEGVDPVAVQQGGIALPVTGRLGIIVYVAVGDAKPQLSIASHGLTTFQGATVASIEVNNTGNAHGRLDGVVQGEDAAGAKFEFAPSTLPVLPGEKRRVTLSPVVEAGKPAPALRFPLKLKGNLEYGRQKLPVDLSFAP